MKWIVMKKHISLILLFSFLSACSSPKIDLYATRQIASTQSCHELVGKIIGHQADLSMVGKTSSLSLYDHPIKLKLLANSVRKQRQRGIKLEDVQMQVTPEVKESLSWMKSQMSEALERGEIQFDLQEQKKTYLIFLDRLDKMGSLEKIGYLDFILQARKFSSMAMMKKEYVGKMSRKWDLQWIQDVLNEKPPSFDIKNFAKEIEGLDQAWFLFPTFKELDIRTMNKAHAEGIGYLGLTMKPIEADGITFNSSDFFEHDLSHIRGFEKDPLRTIEPYSKYPAVNKLSISERRKIFIAFENWLENITENQPEEYHSKPTICERKILTSL